LEAEAVLKCWKDVMEGKFKRFGEAHPKQMTVCTAQRTKSKPLRSELFQLKNPVVSGASAKPLRHNSGFIGSIEGILQHNRQLYKQGHREVCLRCMLSETMRL
jgi:hypothetical protein